MSSGLDPEALKDIDFPALAYLTEQMQNVALLGGAFHMHIEAPEQRGSLKLAVLGVRPDVLADPAKLRARRDEL